MNRVTRRGEGINVKNIKRSNGSKVDLGK